MPDLGDKKELEVIVQQSNQQRANMEEMITGGNWFRWQTIAHSIPFDANSFIKVIIIQACCRVEWLLDQAFKLQQACKCNHKST